MDFKFFFFPWHQAPEYQLSEEDAREVVIPDSFRSYFAELALKHGIRLARRQMAWYVKKAATQYDDMKREYPSIPEEAFAASVEGAYYGDHMAAVEARGGIGEFKAVPGWPVHTFHDIGVSDYHSIWFAQFLPGEIRHVHYYQNCGQGMPHYAEYCDAQYRKHGWVREGALDWLPHDGRVKEWGTGLTRLEQSVAKGFQPKIPKAMSRADGINAVRELLKISTFDAEGCELGIKQLKNYKRKWNDIAGAWMDEPLHNEASHGADAERTLACAYRHPEEPKQDKPKPELSAAAMREEMVRQARNADRYRR